MKYGFPLSHTLIFLTWSMIDYRAAYETAGEWERALESVRWGTDWLLKAVRYLHHLSSINNFIKFLHFRSLPCQSSKVEQNIGKCSMMQSTKQKKLTCFSSYTNQFMPKLGTRPSITTIGVDQRSFQATYHALFL